MANDPDPVPNIAVSREILASELRRMEGALEEASRAALHIFGHGIAKGPESILVTLPDGRRKSHADSLSWDILSGALKSSPFPVLSEHTLRSFPNPSPDTFLVVDPIDGSDLLLAGHDQWIINVCLVSHGRPLAGAVAIPAQNEILIAEVGKPTLTRSIDSAEKVELSPPRKRERAPRLAVVPKGNGGLSQRLYSGMVAFARENGFEPIEMGSAYSYVAVARGEVDIFANSTGNFHWDTAGQQLALEGVGGKIIALLPGNQVVVPSKSPALSYPGSTIVDEAGHIAVRADLLHNTLRVPEDFLQSMNWWIVDDFLERPVT